MEILAKEPLFPIVERLRKMKFSESGKHMDVLQVRQAGKGTIIISNEVTLQERSLVLSARMQQADALFGVHVMQPTKAQAYSMIEITREGLQETTDAAMAFVRSWDEFHLVIDIDVLDPVFVPGIRHPAPGGLTLRELLYVVQRLRLIKSLASIQVIVDAQMNEELARNVACIIAELA